MYSLVERTCLGEVNEAKATTQEMLLGFSAKDNRVAKRYPEFHSRGPDALFQSFSSCRAMTSL